MLQGFGFGSKGNVQCSCGVSGYFGGGCGGHGGKIKGARMVTVTGASLVNAGYDEYELI